MEVKVLARGACKTHTNENKNVCNASYIYKNNEMDKDRDIYAHIFL